MRVASIHRLPVLLLLVSAMACCGGIPASAPPPAGTTITTRPHVTEMALTGKPEATPLVPTVTPQPTLDGTVLAPSPIGDLGNTRPSELAPDVTLIDILQTDPVFEIAWNPEGTSLAYAIDVDRPAEQFHCEIEIRSSPDWQLQQRWIAPHAAHDLTWAPDGRKIAFALTAGPPPAYVAVAQVGQDGWQEFDVGDAGWQMEIAEWLDDENLLLLSGCGIWCRTVHVLNIISGTVSPLQHQWGKLAGITFFSNPGRQWFAATDYGHTYPRTVVVSWSDLTQATPLATGLDTQFTSAQSWTDSTLAFLTYPPGEPEEWALPPRLDLRTWNLVTGERRIIAHGAFHATFAPSGDRLAVSFSGIPQDDGSVVRSAEGNNFHLGLLSWPGGRLLSVYPLTSETIGSSHYHIPIPRWSPQGEAIVFQSTEPGLVLMDHNGRVRSILSDRALGWARTTPDAGLPAYWGTGGHLAIILDGQIWLLQIPLSSTDE